MVRTNNSVLTYLTSLFGMVGYLFLYIPIIVLVLFSFNSQKFLLCGKAFPSNGIMHCGNLHDIWHALQNSLIVAFSTVVLSLTIGNTYLYFMVPVLFWGFFYYVLCKFGNTRNCAWQWACLVCFHFFLCPWASDINCRAYTYWIRVCGAILHSRYQELDKRYMEAALDLGATEGQTLSKVMVPLLMPAINGMLHF